MTDPLDDELGGTRDHLEEMDLDEEDIDLDDVVPDLNPLDSATGGMIDDMYLAGFSGISGLRASMNPFADVQTGESSAFSTEPLTSQEDSEQLQWDSVQWYEVPGQTSHSFITSSRPGSGSPELKLPSKIATTPSADPAKVKAAPSVKTDSGYGSVTRETPKLPQKLQTKRVIRERLDIVIEKRLIEVPPFQAHEDATNSQTLYTGDQNVMGASRARRYILEFANHLYSHLQKPFADDKISSVIGSLRELLEAFALKLGQTSQLQIKRDAMYFIYTERDQITQLMRALFNRSQPKDESDMEFSKQVGKAEDIKSFLDAVTKDPAFKWLVGKLQGLLTSRYINSDAMKNISYHLIQGLPPIQGISRHHPSKPFRVTFDVECDILGFIKDQEYYGAAAEVVPNVITLTGSSDDVQATTCEQYLLQTWPTVGCNLLRAIQGALREYNASKSLQSSYQCKFEDRTKIKVSIGERSLKVEAIGTIHCIVEIGEQIGWFATAFKPTTFHDLEISFCHPELISFQAEDNLHLLSEEFEKSFRCRILTVLDDIKANRLPYARGQCWQQMFNNPIIVTGYPIKPRENIEPGAGLEIPFEMMITLSDARYLTTFNGKTVLKGFSTVLLPMRQQDNLIIWHLLVDVSGARISYLDPRIQKGILISSDNMQNTRHILGWCSEALKNIGSPGANYDIKYSGLSQGKSSLSLEKIEVSVGAGEYFKVGTSFRRGLREGVFARRMSDGYDDRVDHIANQYITLYDVKEKRAWLSDGLPVLLHLVRTSLRRDEKDDPDGLGINLVKNLNEAPPAVQGTMAAKVVLYDADNRSISLRSRTKVTEVTTNRIIDGKTFTEHVKKQETVHYCLENRVEQICHQLEQVIETNVQSRQEGILRRAPRNVLGGYEFMGVAARKNLELLTTKMSISERGSGWTDLLCSISAVTLFGNDFGELIKPRSKMRKHCNGCGLNVSLPSGENLLAVGVDVLEGILFEKGNKDTIPWRLVDDIYWHCNEAAFGHCQCNISGGKSRSKCFDDRIQFLSSNNKNRHYPSLSSINTPTNGAVVFGHGRKKGVTLMGHNMEEVMEEDKSDSSPEDIIRSQTSLGIPVSSDTQNESSETNENLLPDIVSSDTPNTSTSSRMDGSGLAKNTSQISGTEGAATPDASRSTEMPLSGLILVDPNQSAFPDVMYTLSESSAATALNAPGTPLIPHRKRPIEKLKDRSTKAWKKLRHDTST